MQKHTVEKDEPAAKRPRLNNLLWSRVVDYLCEADGDVSDIEKQLQELFDSPSPGEFEGKYSDQSVVDIARLVNLPDVRSTYPRSLELLRADYQLINAKLRIKQLDALLRTQEVIINEALLLVDSTLSPLCRDMLTFLAQYNTANYRRCFVEQFKNAANLWVPEWCWRNVFEKHMFSVLHLCYTLSNAERNLVNIFLDFDYPVDCRLTYGETQAKLRHALGLEPHCLDCHTVEMQIGSEVKKVTIAPTDCGMRNYERLGIYNRLLEDRRGRPLKCTHADWTDFYWDFLYVVPL